MGPGGEVSATALPENENVLSRLQMVPLPNAAAH
jgi:hypothetical protein